MQVMGKQMISRVEFMQYRVSVNEWAIRSRAVEHESRGWVDA